MHRIKQQSMENGQQGRNIDWMDKPDPIPGCPAGLEYLASLNKILVQQKSEAMEYLTGFEMTNKYVVLNPDGKQIYFSYEDECNAFQRRCCGAERGFVLHIVDRSNTEVIRITREFKCCTTLVCCLCCAGCCSPCTNEVKVELVNGEILGYVRQTFNCSKPTFDVMDEAENTILKINGRVLSNLTSGTQVGNVIKEQTGLVDLTYEEDKYNITFPLDMSVRLKAILIASLFLIVCKLYTPNTETLYRESNRLPF